MSACDGAAGQVLIKSNKTAIAREWMRIVSSRGQAPDLADRCSQSIIPIWSGGIFPPAPLLLAPLHCGVRRIAAIEANGIRSARGGAAGPPLAAVVREMARVC